MYFQQLYFYNEFNEELYLNKIFQFSDRIKCKFECILNILYKFYLAQQTDQKIANTECRWRMFTADI